MKTFIETPLCQMVLETWRSDCPQQDYVASEFVTELNDPHFRMKFTAMDLGNEFLKLPTPDGTDIEYHQRELDSDMKGYRKFSECFVFRKGEIESLAYWDFYARDIQLWVKEQDEMRPYDSAPVVISGRPPKEGHSHVLESLASGQFRGSGAAQGLEIVSVPDKLAEIKKKWSRLLKEAEIFGKGFAQRFREIDAEECDSTYILHEIDNRLYIADLGGRKFIDAAYSGKDMEHGLKAAYMKYKPRLMEKGCVEDIDSLLARVSGKGKVGLFTTESFAMQLLGRTDLDYLSAKQNRIRIKDDEFRISLKDRSYDDFFEEFIEAVFTEDEYGIVARRHGLDIEVVRKIVWDAGRSTTIRNIEQRRGAEKRASEQGLRLEDMLSDKEGILLGKIYEEKDRFASKLEIYSDFRWWESLKENCLGLALIARLDDPHFKTRERQQDFRQMFSDAYLSCLDDLRKIDYSMFLELPAERPSSNDGMKFGRRRNGIGNILFDFGSRDMLDRITGKLADICADHGAGPDRVSRVVSSIYEQKKGDMQAYLFKGRLLQPMLDRMLPPEGSTVAVKAHPDRVAELARFCMLERSGDALLYDGVRLVLVGDESKQALAKVKDSMPLEPEDEETEALAELVIKTLDKRPI